MRTHTGKLDLEKFPIHQTGVNPYWCDDDGGPMSSRLVAYLEYRQSHAELEKANLSGRLTHNKVFDHMALNRSSSIIDRTRTLAKSYSKVMLYSIIESFLLVDTPQGALAYQRIAEVRELLVDLGHDSENNHVMDEVIKRHKGEFPTKLLTREALRDVIAFYRYKETTPSATSMLRTS